MRHLLLFVVLLNSAVANAQASLQHAFSPSNPAAGSTFSVTFTVLNAQAGNRSYAITATCAGCTPSTISCTVNTTSPTQTGSFTVTGIIAPASGTNFEFNAVATGPDCGPGCDPALINVPMPVELTQFNIVSAKPTEITLSWQTASEYNHDYFEVEHSLDGKNFSAIGRVAGNGNRGEFSAYSFTHEQAQTGIHYYRLKQVDLDGTFEYSKVISTRLGDHKMVRVFPNPTQNTLKITGLSPEDEVEAITVTDIHGKQVLTMSSLEDGLLDLSGEAAGMYIVTIRYNGKVVADRIIKE